MALRLMFFGTPAFAVPALEALAASAHPLAAVVTQPDRPRGRGHKITFAPVKAFALERGIDVLQPDRLKDGTLAETMRDRGIELAIVAAYGRILPADLLAVPRLGFINIHASLLPRWRGAAPIHRAILAGDAVTGVSIMRVVPALDAGPTLLEVSTPIDPGETSVDLEHRLARLGADAIVQALEQLEAGSAHETPQDESRVTYAARLERSDSPVDFTRPAHDLHNQIRGLHPWPLASARLDGRRVRLIASEVRESPAPLAEPGTVIAIEHDAIVTATGAGLLALRRVQLEGRPVVSARDFLNGHRVVPGDRFTTDRPGADG